MSKGFIIGSAGTSSLNFKVLGGTEQPAYPGENTIWINTASQITAWSMSAAAPTEPEEGQVWIAIGALGSVTLNLLKKNGVLVGIYGAKQYLSGQWLNQNMLIYRDGAWSATIAYVYLKGELYESFTGGFKALAVKTSADYPRAKAPNVTYNAESIYLKISVPSTDGQVSGRLSTVNKIDLTPFSTVTINVLSYNRDGTLILHVVTEHGTYVASNSVASVSITKSGEISLDVSGVNEPCYICISMYRASSITFDEIRLDV